MNAFMGPPKNGRPTELPKIEPAYMTKLMMMRGCFVLSLYKYLYMESYYVYVTLMVYDIILLYYV